MEVTSAGKDVWYVHEKICSFITFLSLWNDRKLRSVTLWLVEILLIADIDRLQNPQHPILLAWKMFIVTDG